MKPAPETTAVTPIDGTTVEPAKKVGASPVDERPRRSIAAAALLRIPVLRRLFAARTISVLGDMVVPVALSFAVLDFGGGAAGLGIVLASRAAPEVLLLLFGGVAGDRYRRRAVLMVSNGTACIAQLLTGLLVVTGSAEVWNVAVPAALLGATSAFFNPASTAAIAHVAPDNERQATYALFAITSNVAKIAGPSLAGLLLVVCDPGWLLVLDAASFLVSAIMIGRAGELGRTATGAGGSFGTEVRAGLKYVMGTRWLCALIASASAFQLFLLATLSVLGPLVARDELGGASAWAAIAAAMGAGGVVGGALAMRVRPRRPLLAGYSSLLLGSGPTLLLLAIPAPTPVLAATEFIAGIVIAYFEALESAAIATRVPGGMLSRIDSIDRFGSMSLRPIGMACVGPVAAVIGIRPALIGAGVITLVCVATPLLLRDVRGLEDRGRTAAHRSRRPRRPGRHRADPV